MNSFPSFICDFVTWSITSIIMYVLKSLSLSVIFIFVVPAFFAVISPVILIVAISGSNVSYISFPTSKSSVCISFSFIYENLSSIN